ncbi:MAG: 2,3-bisphosphoglycerate-independent phosphoglycerate mutase, partial [Nanoarchaeota archaeon]
FVVNFANGDMIGHTGNLKAAIKAVEEVDRNVGKIVNGFPGKIIITADHGNCEDMTNRWQTSHTTNSVPFIVVDKIRQELEAKQKLKREKEKAGKIKLRNGGLADVAPTILRIMEIKKPKEMSGKSLF